MILALIAAKQIFPYFRLRQIWTFNVIWFYVEILFFEQTV